MAANLKSIIAGIKADPGLRAETSAKQIGKGIDAAKLLNSVLLTMIEETKVNRDGQITEKDMVKISNALWNDQAKYAYEWRKFFEGHGNDNGDVVSGFHWVQNDGGTQLFQGRNFIDTVADAIYHFGFQEEKGRYVNEDGNDNETLIDVAGWLNYFLNGKNIVYGTNGDDDIGSGEYSSAFKAARSETFMAGRGNDRVWADVGNDRVKAGSGHDEVGGGNGNDRIWGQKGNDKLWGDVGNDRMYGGTGADQMGGGDGKDKMLGGKGSDTMGGGAGNDRMDGGKDADTLYGDDGNDRMDGGAGRDDLNGGLGSDRISGGSGADKIYGSDGNDRLKGGSGNDEIGGGAGKDKIEGGKGADAINIWEQSQAVDTIVFGKGDSGKTANTMDRVEGFASGVDKIDLSALGPMKFAKLDFVGHGKASAYFDGDYLRIDVDGNGSNDMMVEFVYVSSLSAGDFIFS